MDKRFGIILAATVLVLGAIFFTRDNGDSATTNAETVSNHVTGANTGGVAIVEYADFQCPACYSMYPVIKAVKEKYGDKISFQFVNLPLTQLHPKAMAAHKAAEAASIQNKFWEFHDKLYEQRAVWAADGISIETTEKYFEGFAEDLGLDLAAFKTDARSEKVNDTIKADIQKATDLKVRSTPTFFINGEPLSSESQAAIRDVNEFYKLIDAKLAEKAESTEPVTN